MRSRSVKRLEKVAVYLRAILPGFTAQMTLAPGPPVDRLMIPMMQLPDDLVVMAVWIDSPGIYAAVFASSADGPIVGPRPVATKIHTDDEIARKIAVAFAESIQEMAESMASEGGRDHAEVFMEQRDRVIQELNEWGRGTGWRYTP